MKTHYILPFLITVFLSCINIYAETTSPPPSRTVLGRVIDQTTNQPVEYATVALYKMPEKKLITGGITNQRGLFSLKDIKNGNYIIEIKFIGYNKFTSKDFNITDNNSFVKIGKVILSPLSEVLNEVQVTASDKNIEYKIDKKVVNVSKQLTSSSGSAVDVLENIPSVTVDVNGDVALRGSNSFTVLIDGKPTVLDANDVLKQIPSSAIQNIELITNPSVKYDPDGTSGIINIVTKKNKLSGISGMATLSAGTFDNYSGNALVNLRKNKFNYSIGANFRDGNMPTDKENKRETFSNDTTWITSSNGDATRNYSMKSFNAGVEWSISSNDQLSLSGKIGQFNVNNESNLHYNEEIIVKGKQVSDEQYNSTEDSKRANDFFSINTTYTHQFAKKGHEIQAQFNYMERDGSDYSGSKLTESNGQIKDGKNNLEEGPSKRYVTKIDYSLPLNKESKLEAGFQSRVAENTDITKLYEYDPTTQDFVLNENFSRQTNYTRDIYSMYVQYATKIDKFGIQAGLREEYTNREIGNDASDEKTTINRWDWFPTLHLSYHLSDEDQLMTSYTRRIHRTRGYLLEPFITWVDNYNVRQGNPNLIPELIDSYEVTYLKEFGQNFLSVDLFYRVTHNKIENIQSVYQENIVMRTPENVGQDFSLGSELTLSLSPYKWWKINLMGDLYNYKVEGQMNNQDFSRSSFNWSGRFNNTFMFNRTTSVQINNSYHSGSATAQGSNEGYYSMDIAARKSFLDRKLNATLQMRNVLNTITRESFLETPNLRTYSASNISWPMINLTLSYTFNNFKKARNKRDGAESDMEMEEF